MNWESIGVGVSVAVALLGANAWLMKLVISSEINKFHILVSKDFVSKEECSEHRANGSCCK